MSVLERILGGIKKTSNLDWKIADTPPAKQEKDLTLGKRKRVPADEDDNRPRKKVKALSLRQVIALHRIEQREKREREAEERLKTKLAAASKEEEKEEGEITPTDNSAAATPNHLLRVNIIASTAECMAAVSELKKHPYLAVDCEGVNLSRHGRLCLVQVATPATSSTSADNVKVFLFDIVAGGNALFDAGLREILESTSIIKVMHDCRVDSDTLYHQFQVRLANVFDTQIAFAILQRQEGRPTPLPAGLNTILRKYALGHINEYKEKARSEMIAEDYWQRRPMSETMIGYASQDVMYLPVAYRQISALLVRQSLTLVMETSKEYLEQRRSQPEGAVTPIKYGDTTYIPTYGIADWDVAAQSRLQPRTQPTSTKSNNTTKGTPPATTAATSNATLTDQSAAKAPTNQEQSVAV